MAALPHPTFFTFGTRSMQVRDAKSLRAAHGRLESTGLPSREQIAEWPYRSVVEA